jgi:hypothetical protein
MIAAVAFAATSALGASGAITLVAAGRFYMTGQDAGGHARRGGLLMAGGAAAGIPSAAILLTGAGADGTLAIVSLVMLGLAGLAGLLAGLSRKPRPTGTVAVALFFLASVAVLLLACGVPLPRG